MGTHMYIPCAKDMCVCVCDITVPEFITDNVYCPFFFLSFLYFLSCCWDEKELSVS